MSEIETITIDIKKRATIRKLIPLTFVSGHRYKYVEIRGLNTNTTLKIHREHLPALIGGLNLVHRELTSPLSSSSGRPSSASYTYDVAKHTLTLLRPRRRSSGSKQRSSTLTRQP